MYKINETRSCLIVLWGANALILLVIAVITYTDSCSVAIHDKEILYPVELTIVGHKKEYDIWYITCQYYPCIPDSPCENPVFSDIIVSEDRSYLYPVKYEVGKVLPGYFNLCFYDYPVVCKNYNLQGPVYLESPDVIGECTATIALFSVSLTSILIILIILILGYKLKISPPQEV